MGEMAEYYNEQSWEDMFPEPYDYLYHRVTHEDTWETKNFKILKIKDMETSHIKNCIAILEKKGQEYTKAYQGLTKELKERE